MNAVSRHVLTDIGRDLWHQTWQIDEDTLRLNTGHRWSIRKRTLRGGLCDGVDLIEGDNGALSF